jgi:hypothetical protein
MPLLKSRASSCAAGKSEPGAGPHGVPCLHCGLIGLAPGRLRNVLDSQAAVATVDRFWHADPGQLHPFAPEFQDP